MKIKAVSIIWDTDNEDIELPNEVIIPNDVIEEGNETSVADYLSDNYNWCVISFNLVEVK